MTIVVSGLTLITPTSDRPEAFALCERWMRRALDRFGGVVQWIVADDGRQPAECALGQLHMRREPTADRAASFVGNLLAAIEQVKYDRVLFIEDDDWYGPDYLKTMHSWLDDAEIVGESRARYYNVATRRYKVCGNTHHASLCQTGVRADLLREMGGHLQRHASTFLDIHAWKTISQGRPRLLRPETTLSTGIKGLPGTTGIGTGHRLSRRHATDSQGTVLSEWTTKEDAQRYFQLFEAANGQVRHVNPQDAQPTREETQVLDKKCDETNSALAILTFVPADADEGVLQRLPEAIRSLETTDYPGPVIIVDDGSPHAKHHAYLNSLPEKYRVIRRQENGGISLGKNTCMRAILETDAEIGFIAEDDIEFLDGWHRQYIRAHLATGIQHFCWALDDDPWHRMRKIPQSVRGFPVAMTTRLAGVFVTFTRDVAKRVGGFKPLAGKWGHMHANWTRRIIAAGLSPHFVDVTDSNRYVRLNAQHVHSTVPDAEKQHGMRANRSAATDTSAIFLPVLEDPPPPPHNCCIDIKQLRADRGKVNGRDANDVGGDGREVPRHLIYFVCPLKANDASWQFNLEQLSKYYACFTGRKVIAVATGDECHDVSVVQEHLPDDIEYLQFSNHPDHRESVGFLRLVESVIEEDGITFYGHCKGVSHHHGGGRPSRPYFAPAVKLWAQANYDALLASPELIQQALFDKWFVGLFVRHGIYRNFGPVAHEVPWHLCGTFFWMRNDRVRETDWRSRIRLHQYCTETWPTLVCRGDSGKVAGFLPDIGRNDDPFTAVNWTHKWCPSIKCTIRDYEAVQT